MNYELVSILLLTFLYFTDSSLYKPPFIVRKITLSELIIYFSIIVHCCTAGVWVLRFMFSMMISALNNLGINVFQNRMNICVFFLYFYGIRFVMQGSVCSVCWLPPYLGQSPGLRSSHALASSASAHDNKASVGTSPPLHLHRRTSLTPLGCLRSLPFTSFVLWPSCENGWHNPATQGQVFAVASFK